MQFYPSMTGLSCQLMAWPQVPTDITSWDAKRASDRDHHMGMILTDARAPAKRLVSRSQDVGCTQLETHSLADAVHEFFKMVSDPRPVAPTTYCATPEFAVTHETDDLSFGRSVGCVPKPV
jgi:hypothetical protein